MKPYGWRDRIVIAVANFVLRFGSRHLQDMLAGTIVFGLSMAKQEAEVASRTGRPPTAAERDTMRRHAWHQR